MVRFLLRIRDFWCDLVHDQLTWPICGQYYLQEVLEDIHGSLGQRDSPQGGGPASAIQEGICADAPLTEAANGVESPTDDIRSGIQRRALLHIRGKRLW